MRVSVFAFTLLFLAITVSPVLAQAPITLAPSQFDSVRAVQRLNPASIFAYPGQACPAGSEPYKGPEAVRAEGFVYCAFPRRTSVFPKKYFDKCPPGMKPYTDDKATPPDDVFWCIKDWVDQKAPALAPAMSSPMMSLPKNGAAQPNNALPAKP